MSNASLADRPLPDNSSLMPVERLEVHVLVDNVTDGLSSTAADERSEFASLIQRGLRPGSPRCLCCAVHGLSLLLTTHRAGEQRTVLFDTGPEEVAFERNVVRTGANLGSVDAVVMSHGHWDHCGALLVALDRIRSQGPLDRVPVHAHPGMFRTRAVTLLNGVVTQMDDVPSVEELAGRGATVMQTVVPETLLDGAFHVSGEIPRVTSFERGFPGHLRRSMDGQRWEPDEAIEDERWIGVHVEGKGLVVFSACSHAGIVNVLRHARAQFSGIPLHAVVGGLHLAGATEPQIPETIDAIAEFDLKVMAVGHCTGWRATSALVARFGDHVVRPSAVGKHYSF